jgi:ATP-dependent exoDNAse (exonuclease V) alpha subunit
MLTYNLDVCDSLTNGSQGQVIDFKYGKHGKIKYILVKFDENESGRERRKGFNFGEEYPGITPIEMKETTFSLSKNKTNASSTATALQFPLKLAYAATAHKVQGHTVKHHKHL